MFHKTIHVLHALLLLHIFLQAVFCMSTYKPYNGDPGTADFHLAWVQIQPASGVPHVCQRKMGYQKLRHDDKVLMSLQVANVTYFAKLEPNYSYMKPNVILDSNKGHEDPHSLVPVSLKGNLYFNESQIGDISIIVHDDGMSGECLSGHASVSGTFSIGLVHYSIAARDTVLMRGLGFYKKMQQDIAEGRAKEYHGVLGPWHKKHGLPPLTHHGMRLHRRNVPREKFGSWVESAQQREMGILVVYDKSILDLKPSPSEYHAIGSRAITEANEIFQKQLKLKLVVAASYAYNDLDDEGKLVFNRDKYDTISNYLWEVGNYTQGIRGFNSFTQYSGKVHLVHVFTTRSFGKTIGLAHIGENCAPLARVGITVETDSFVETFTHEVGHNLGAGHDCAPQTLESCGCDGTNYLMYFESNNAKDLSPCSIEHIGRNINFRQNCLPQTYIVVNKCGNGRVDVGEDCDSGKEEDECCSKDCRFKSKQFTCSDKNQPICCKGCMSIHRNKLCREATNFCDNPEYCDNVGNCMPDLYKPDGTLCKIDNNILPAGADTSGQCTSGTCSSRDLQCHKNARGSKFCADFAGDCGMWCQKENSGCEMITMMDDGESTGMAFESGTLCGMLSLCNGIQCEGPKIQVLKSLLSLKKEEVIIFATVIGGVVAVMIVLLLLRSRIGIRVEQKASEIQGVARKKGKRIRHRLEQVHVEGPRALLTPRRRTNSQE